MINKHTLEFSGKHQFTFPFVVRCIYNKPTNCAYMGEGDSNFEQIQDELNIGELYMVWGVEMTSQYTKYAITMSWRTWLNSCRFEVVSDYD